MGSIYAESIPSSMRLLFERQETDSDTFGFSSDSELCADSEIEFTGPDFLISDGEEDQDFDIMFSSSSENFVEGYSELGLYMVNTNQNGCLIDV